MHLLIDGQALQTSSSRLRGIGRYSSNLLRALAVARPDWRIEVVQNRALPPVPDDDLAGLPVLNFPPPLPAANEHREANERYYADWLTARGSDGVLVLSHCEGWEAVVPWFCGPRPHVFGIAYDLIPLLYPEHYLTDYGTSNWYAHRFRHLLRCDALLAISEATARDVRTLGGEQAPPVVNIAGAVDPLFAPLSPEEMAACAEPVRQRHGLKREFLLYVGALDYRKNVRGAIRAFGALPVEHRRSLDLAVVCRMKPAQQESLMETARAAGVADELKLIDSPSDEELRALYQMCRLFFFPSLYEGLGLPVLEALHCGAPVVTADCSSLPEYAGPVSWRGDPTSPEAMARILQQALTEPRDARRAEREAFARTFNWRRTAERACAAIERSIRRPAEPVRRRSRLAWVVPLTSETRSATEYALGLLPLLSERFDIELIAGPTPAAPPETLSRDHLILTPQEVLGRHAAAPFDLFVYQFASAPPPSYMLELLKQFPGLVLLNDFAETDLIRLSECNLLDPSADQFAPVLGLLTHSDRAWQQIRRSTNTSVVCLPRTAALVAAWIDQAISRHQQGDGLWQGFAVRCLAECGSAADSAIDSWAGLRATGQHQLARRRTNVVCATAPSSAA
ncbi:MAG TPA: glycosyltransferase family 1 protein [Gemmataceae bacterium]|jgi:glycosyltransferase involved in cell wall biosynthesis